MMISSEDGRLLPQTHQLTKLKILMVERNYIVVIDTVASTRRRFKTCALNQ